MGRRNIFYLSHRQVGMIVDAFHGRDRFGRKLKPIKLTTPKPFKLRTSKPSKQRRVSVTTSNLSKKPIPRATGVDERVRFATFRPKPSTKNEEGSVTLYGAIIGGIILLASGVSLRYIAGIFAFGLIMLLMSEASKSAKAKSNELKQQEAEAINLKQQGEDEKDKKALIAKESKISTSPVQTIRQYAKISEIPLKQVLNDLKNSGFSCNADDVLNQNMRKKLSRLYRLRNGSAK